LKKIITILPALVLSSLGGCASDNFYGNMSPEQIRQYQLSAQGQQHEAEKSAQMADLIAAVKQLGQVGTNMQNSAAQSQQANAQLFQATQSANREWTQRNAQGVIVHCIQAGNVISCK